MQMTADIINLAEYRSAKASSAAHASPEVPMHEAIAICFAHREILTPWEEQFVISIRRSRRELSLRQRAVLQEIFDKVCGATEDNAS
jgi:hypothetical protein